MRFFRLLPRSPRSDGGGDWCRARRHRAHSLSLGFSLLEILVVLAIIGLLAGATGYALYQHFAKAKIQTTFQQGLKIRGAVQMYRMSHASDECPTVAKLVDDEILDTATKRTDAWEKPFVVVCEEREIRVTSGGPDGRIGTPDDVTVPIPLGPEPRADR